MKINKGCDPLVKKTKTKAFANLILSVLLLFFEGWVWTQSLVIKTQKNAAVQPATFPQIMVIGMAVFTVILLIQSIIKLAAMQATDPLAADAPNLNPVKNRGLLAALVVIALCILYTALFKTLGYVVVSAVICALIMVLIGKRKPLTVILVSILVPLGMWLIFYKMLQVNIPMGILQPLRDLVDMI